jgi:hypothetical protein
MFLLGGAMMLLVGAATLRGWMWHHAPSLGGGDPSGLVGIYLMGRPGGGVWSADGKAPAPKAASAGGRYARNRLTPLGA